MRNEYSDRIKVKIWGDKVQTIEALGKFQLLCAYLMYQTEVVSLPFFLPINTNYTNTERNILEYASEDYNWRNVCLEEEMYTCSSSQELIHPVHLETGQYTFGTGGKCQRSFRYEC